MRKILLALSVLLLLIGCSPEPEVLTEGYVEAIGYKDIAGTSDMVIGMDSVPVVIEGTDPRTDYYAKVNGKWFIVPIRTWQGLDVGDAIIIVSKGQRTLRVETWK